SADSVGALRRPTRWPSRPALWSAATAVAALKAPTLSAHSESLPDGRVDQRLLLLFVPVMRPGRRRGADRTPRIAQLLVRAEHRAEALVEERPGAHVARLLLHPHHLRRIRVRRHGRGEQLLREGVVLLEAEDG